jgi:hypothetical protein
MQDYHVPFNLISDIDCGHKGGVLKYNGIGWLKKGEVDLSKRVGNGGNFPGGIEYGNMLNTVAVGRADYPDLLPAALYKYEK